MNEDISTDTCFGVSKSMLLDLCCSSPFPGTMKWPAEHPIWDCHVAGKSSPREAWTSIECLQKAIDNLYWILNKCSNGTHHSYPSFIDGHRRAFAQVGLPTAGECMKICEKIQTKVEQYLKDKPVYWWRKIIKEANTFDNVELKLRIPNPKGFETGAFIEYKYEPSRDEC